MAHQYARRLADLIEQGLSIPDVIEQRHGYVRESYSPVRCCVIGLAFVARYVEETGSISGVEKKFWKCIDEQKGTTRTKFGCLGEYIEAPNELLYAIEPEHFGNSATARQIVERLRAGAFDFACETKEVALET